VQVNVQGPQMPGVYLPQPQLPSVPGVYVQQPQIPQLQTPQLSVPQPSMPQPTVTAGAPSSTNWLLIAIFSPSTPAFFFSSQFTRRGPMAVNRQSVQVPSTRVR